MKSLPISLRGEKWMRVATIVPTAYLELTEDKNYHMALGHLIGENVYTKFFKDQAKQGKFVILDNGVIETGIPMTILEIVNRAKFIGASELILPDILDDAEATLDAACNAISYARKHFMGKLMGVPQGKTLEEWFECAIMMLSLDVDTIGIPKRLVKIGGRDARLDVLQRLGWSLRGRDVHLLGCWENPIEVAMINRAANAKEIVPIRGVDSCIPYVYARDNMLISQGPRPSGAVDFSAHDADLEKLKINMDTWESECTNRSGMYRIC